jgi:hypothetical protein
MDARWSTAGCRQKRNIRPCVSHIGSPETNFSFTFVQTPELGIKLDAQCSATDLLLDGDLSFDSDILRTEPLGFFRTIIEPEKEIVHHWPVECQGLWERRMKTQLHVF